MRTGRSQLFRRAVTDIRGCDASCGVKEADGNP